VSHRAGHALSEHWLRGWRDSAFAAGIAVVPLPFARTIAEVDALLAAARREAVQVLVSEGPVSVLLGAGFERIKRWAIEHKVLTFGTTWVRGQHLVAFGPDQRELQRIAAAQIDRILRGARPAEMPIEQPTRFELIVHAGLARAMGLSIPPAVRLQATEVIE
jgi:putative ABC transport system substrate-binding protein